MRKIILLVIAFFICSSAMAGPVKEIVFFGDSLSDDGNLYQKLKIVPKSPPYYKGRFSNGPTWAEHVGDHFYKKSFIDYSNYCYGGATAILHRLRTDKFIAPIILGAELDAYFLRSLRKDKRQSVYALWIGANDYLYETEPNLDGLTSNVVNKINESATTLLDKGAHGVLILNLPDLSFAPYAKNHHTEQRLSAISRMHNSKLNDAVKKLSVKYPGRVMHFDVYALFTDLLANTGKYNQIYGTNITDTTQSCWLGTVLGLDNASVTLEAELKASGVDQENMQVIMHSPSLYQSYLLGQAYEKGQRPCDNAEQHLFWDDLHPTAVVHQVLGQVIIEQLENNRWI